MRKKLEVNLTLVVSEHQRIDIMRSLLGEFA